MYLLNYFTSAAEADALFANVIQRADNTCDR